MRVTRTIAVLLGGLAVLLVVVVIRAESARLEHERSRLETQEIALQLQLRESELEISRLKNPQRIHEQALELRGETRKPAQQVPARAPASRKRGDPR